MISIIQYLDPGQWRDTLQAGADHVVQMAFWVAVLQIIFINILLSGDNAVVIAMACRGLPPRQRFWGVVIGAGVAVVLRIIFAGLIVELMQLPFLKLIGGVALVYIAAKLLQPEDSDRRKLEAVAHLWHAVRIVALADVVMSLDNVIAVAAAAKGSVLLLAIGLAISVPLIVAGAAVFMALLEHFPILVWAGAAMLGWVAGDVIATDPVVLDHVTSAVGEKFAGQIELAFAAVAAVSVIAVGGLWRHLQLTRTAARRDKTSGT